MDEQSKVKRMTGTIKHLLAEITQLRAELEQERELADRLALKLEAYIYMTGSTIGAGAMQEYNNRRNK